MTTYLFVLFFFVLPLLIIFGALVIEADTKKERIIGIALMVGWIVTFAFMLNHHIEDEKQMAIVEYKAGYYKESVKKVYVDGTLVKYDTTYKRIKKD